MASAQISRVDQLQNIAPGLVIQPAVAQPGSAAFSLRGQSSPDGLIGVDQAIGVDRQLWRASSGGKLVEVVETAALGLPGAPANLVRHPDGGIVVTVRDDPALYLLEATSVRPQWPEDLAPHARRLYREQGIADASFRIQGVGRFRINLHRERGRAAAAICRRKY